MTGTWLIESPLPPQTPELRLATEVRAFEQTATQLAGRAYLWEPDRRTLVVTRSEARLPGFDAAVRRLAQEGWPVSVRSSGGAAVPLVPGTLVLTLIYRERPGPDRRLDRAFETLCRPLEQALKAFGIEARHGEVAGSFCDGRYNLVVGGRKLAGTAQRQRPDAAGVAIMSHAVVLVAAAAREEVAVVNRFYELAGSDRRIDPDTATTLEELLSAASAPGLLATLRSQVVASLAAAATTQGIVRGRCLQGDAG